MDEALVSPASARQNSADAPRIAPASPAPHAIHSPRIRHSPNAPITASSSSSTPNTHAQTRPLADEWFQSPQYHRLHELSNGPSQRPLRFLGISLFDGIGAFWGCFDPFCGDSFEWAAQLSSEVDEHALRVYHHRFPGLTHLGDIITITSDMLESYVIDTHPDVIVLGGGSPCKQLSAAGCWHHGLTGRDSSLFFEFARVHRELTAMCQSQDIPLFCLFENVVPRDTKNTAIITDQLKLGRPYLCDAADVSYMRRRRLVWTNALVPPVLQPAVDHSTTADTQAVTMTIPHQHRHLPSLGSIFRSQWRPLYLRNSGTQDHPEGRFPVLTILRAGPTRCSSLFTGSQRQVRERLV